MSGQTNEKKSSDARFNIFDVIIILILLICIAAVSVRAYFTANIRDTFENATIEFTVSGVSKNTAASFHQYRKIYFALTNDEIGSITEVSYGPAKLYAADASGTPIEVDHPDKKDVHGTATFSGIWTDDGFMINGTELATVGKSIHIYTHDVECILTIVSVSKSE